MIITLLRTRENNPKYWLISDNITSNWQRNIKELTLYRSESKRQDLLQTYSQYIWEVHQEVIIDVNLPNSTDSYLITEVIMNALEFKHPELFL
jgi:endonuclease/exonuclease/phosphatase (EEP) superfamily protein YafD